MKHRWLTALLLPCLLPATAAAQFQKPYAIDSIAPGVFAVVWQDMMSYPYEGNHLVVVTDRDVIVVDANRTPELTDTVIAIVRRTTNLPVTHVINTHWHADHVQGNSVYQREFPGVRIVGHPNTVAGIDSVLIPYVRDEVRTGYEDLKTRLDDETSVLPEDERAGLGRQLESLERENVLYDAVTLVKPNLLVRDSLVLDRGTGPIVIFHPGWGNTDGDLAVWLPVERVLAVGDQVTEPFPLLGWDAPRSWYRSLESMLALGPSVVLPGHGEVQRSMEFVELYRDFLRDLSTQVAEGAEAGKTLEDLQGGVDLVRYWEAFADGNERMVQAFVTRFQPEAVKRAWVELGRP